MSNSEHEKRSGWWKPPLTSPRCESRSAADEVIVVRRQGIDDQEADTDDNRRRPWDIPQVEEPANRGEDRDDECDQPANRLSAQELKAPIDQHDCVERVEKPPENA